MRERSILGKGQYLAPVTESHDYGKLLVGVTKYPEPTKTGKWHSHERALISYVLEGGNLENRANRQLERSAGSINFYRAHEPHQNIYKVFPSKHYSLEIDDTFLAENEINEEQLEKATGNNPKSKLLFLKILREVLIGDRVSDCSVEMLFLKFSANASTGYHCRTEPLWVQKLRDYLNEHWNKQHKLAELSRQAGVHPVTISANFRKYFSCTFGQYMRKIKIDRALSLIRTTDQQLTRIAFRCGFADQSHFTRTFKEQTGFLPKEFQNL